MFVVLSFLFALASSMTYVNIGKSEDTYRWSMSQTVLWNVLAMALLIGALLAAYTQGAYDMAVHIQETAQD